MIYRNPTSESVNEKALLLQRETATYLYRLPPQYKEALGSLGKEPGEFVHEDVFYLVGLFDSDADPY